MYKSGSYKYINYDIPLLLGFGLLIIFYHTTAISIYDNWTSESSLYSHGLLLLPISFYLFFKEWKISRSDFKIKFRPIPSIILILLSIFWYISESVYIQIISQICFIFILAFYVYSLLGFKQSLRLSFPILILLSTIPLWFVFSEPLQTPTALLVDNLLKLTGYTSFRDGYYIHIPEGIFEVGDTCSGLRYQIAAITTVALYVYYYRYSVKASLVSLVMASVVAFLSNAVRIYIVVLAGHYTNMTHSLLDDHIWLGWVVFGLFFILFLFFLGRLEQINHTFDSTVVKSEHITSPDSKPINLARISAILIVLIVFSSIGPFLIQIYIKPGIKTDIENIKINTDVSSWSRIDSTKLLRPNWQPSDLELLSRYSNETGTIDLFISTFINQSQGKELISDLNFPYNTNDWYPEKSYKIDIASDSGETYTFTETIISNRYMQKRVVWNWFYINGTVTHDKLHAKLLGVLAPLSGTVGQTVFVISSSYINDMQYTRRLHKEFFEQSFYHFKGQLDSLSSSFNE